MSHFAVTAIGDDRPGIVAAVAGSLFELGCNLEDVSSTILRGSFAIMLVVDAPVGLDRIGLEHRLDTDLNAMGMSVEVRGTPGERVASAPTTHTLVAYGSDRPGLVARMAAALADRDVNITDLSCRLVGDEDPVYAMVADLAVPAATDADALARAIAGLATEMGVDATFHAVETETL
ncbi:MAG: glycine cleavage system protein R [Actinomycetota bacterium]